MVQKLKNIGLYISSFVPLYVLVIIKTLLEIVNGNLHFNITNTILLILMLILTIYGILAVRVSISSNKNLKEIVVIGFQNTTDEHFLGYFSLFVLFALTFDLSKISMSIVYIIILILIGVVYIKNSLYNINPFLNLIGYSCYNVKFRDKEGAEYSQQIFYKGKLNMAKYLISYDVGGICYVKKQILKKKKQVYRIEKR